MVSTKQASGLIAVRVRVPPFGIGKFFSLATSCPSLSGPHLPHVSGRTYHFLAEVRILCVTPVYSFSGHQIMLSPLYFLFYSTLRILHVTRFGISGKFQVFFPIVRKSSRRHCAERTCAKLLHCTSFV